MQVHMIVATALNHVIGGGNNMLWHVPEDFKHFKKVTMGRPVVMGRKTHESIGRPLPGRKNVVISRTPGYAPEGVEVVSSLEEAYRLLKDEELVFVIGGGQIYRQALPKATRIWLTVMGRDFEGDTTFPELDDKEWKRTLIEHLEPEGKRDFGVDFYTLDRI